jgi:hypothetical protein
MDRYDKLVRDDIPDVIRENGDEPVTHVTTGEAYRERLHDNSTRKSPSSTTTRASTSWPTCTRCSTHSGRATASGSRNSTNAGPRKPPSVAASRTASSWTESSGEHWRGTAAAD